LSQSNSNTEAAAEDTLQHTDEGYTASWNLSDKADIWGNYFWKVHQLDEIARQKYFHKNIREIAKHDRNKLVAEFRDRLKRRYNDQTVYDFKLKDRYFKPEQLGYKFDRVLNDGMQRMAENATGENTRVFSYFQFGTGNSDTYPNTKGLEAEVLRVNMFSDKGFFTASGTTLNLAGFASEAVATFPIVEVGATDDDGSNPTTAVSLFRSVFPSTEIVTHTFGQNFTTAVHVIYQRSV
jgi:hypothetical protein